jgi:hypothetical protein
MLRTLQAGLGSLPDGLRRRIGDSATYRRRLRRRLAGVERLHVGCGAIWVPGWLNIGMPRPRLQPYGTLRDRDGALVLSLDVSRGLPADDASVEHVYGSHFIEHLPLEEGLAFLAECHRVLRPGGLIRLTCPDLELWARKYLENDSAFLEAYRQATAAARRRLPALRTRGQVMMSQLHGWGHRWGYDAESLCEVLERSGFRDAKRRGYCDSELPDIERLELADPVKLLETLCVEAVRP